MRAVTAVFALDEAVVAAERRAQPVDEISTRSQVVSLTFSVSCAL